MSKLKISAVLEQINREGFGPLEKHPLFGLRDQRGWLTRYPIDGDFDLQKIEYYISEGVSFDSNGDRGPSPFKTRYAEKSAFFWRYFQKRELAASRQIDDALVKKHNINSEEDYDVAMLGKTRIPMLRRAGIFFTNEMTVGKMSTKEYNKLLRNKEGYVGRRRVISYKGGYLKAIGKLLLKAFESNPALLGKIDFSRFTYSDGSGYRGLDLKFTDSKVSVNLTLTGLSCVYSWTNWYVGDFFEILNDISRKRDYRRSLKTSPEKENLYGIKTEDGRTLPYKHSRSYWTEVYIGNNTYVTTLEGSSEIFLLKGRIYRRITFSKTILVLNKPAFIYKTGDRYFLFRDKSEIAHVEGTSIKDVVNKIIRRETVVLRDGVSLLDCKDELGYCFQGTKEFLGRKLKHIYYLISKYETWNEVPRTILETKFYPLEEKFSNGYNPLRLR